jgi:hypothetical protein
MAKKTKSVFNGIKSKALPLVIEFLEKEAVNVISWVKDMINIKQRIRKMATSLILIIAGITVLLLGIANYIAELAKLSPALMQIITGIIIIVAAIIYKKS